MGVDWSAFQDGDRVRATFEGVLSDGLEDGARVLVAGKSVFVEYGMLRDVVSAELIERPFTPPAKGTLFRSGSGAVHIAENDGYRTIRTPSGEPAYGDRFHSWADEYPAFFRSIEVLDV